MGNIDFDDNEIENEKLKNSRKRKHGSLMILCCLIPIILIAVLPFFGIKGGLLSSLAFLFCPLMHIVMLFLMKKSGNDKSCCATDKAAQE